LIIFTSRFKFYGLFCRTKHFDLYKFSESSHLIDMEFCIANEIDFALFIDHSQNPQGMRKKLLQDGQGRFSCGEPSLFAKLTENGVAALGILLIRALVINEGILDIPLAEL